MKIINLRILVLLTSFLNLLQVSVNITTSKVVLIIINFSTSIINLFIEILESGFLIKKPLESTIHLYLNKLSNARFKQELIYY